MDVRAILCRSNRKCRIYNTRILSKHEKHSPTLVAATAKIPFNNAIIPVREWPLKMTDLFSPTVATQLCGATCCTVKINYFGFFYTEEARLKF